MAAASSLLSEDYFLCAICLDVFTEPVTVPCGHNFCKNCITEHWNINVQCKCPMCDKSFDRRPVLYVNTFISEIVSQFRLSVQNKSNCSSEEQHANTGDVLCDVCSKTKLKALKSCLVCLASYCETHLEPHHRITGLRRHKLIDPVENLEGRVCTKHERPLELFCKTDQMCVCQFCTESDHKLHHIIPLIEECDGRKAELGKTEAEVQQMIQERRLKIEQIKQSVKLSKEDADRETADSVQVFTALIQSVQRSLAERIEMIQEKQKTTEEQAEGFVKELEEEILKLTKRIAELEQLSHNDDHLQFLQSFPSLNTVPPTKDWTEFRVHSSHERPIRSTMAQLEETLSQEIERQCVHVELKRVQQYAVDVTLDPETANHYLILSDDGKQVNHGDVRQNLPDSQKRFLCSSVLGKQSFSSGRFYYEVQVKGKTNWILGVGRESISRTGDITWTPANGFWCVRLANENGYEVAGSSVHLSLKSKPQKVGVFVDYEEGLVSFYEIDAAALIYSFTDCNFTEKLYPYFSPCHNCDGKNSSPLIICSINHTE
ncbi:E3 ubiquitin-protein ligase TRIM21-like [Pagrus major]|uniref:E3 ubiquitin-protein ligase TRIM21-like n=1 Tax=Pagrus major TaxID=143350 RepID=UPI003CC8D5C4